MTDIKAVLDTNVYLSGIIFGGNCRHILDLSIAKKITTYISPGSLLEIAQKLQAIFHWNSNQITITIKTISKTAILVKPKIKIDVVRFDTSDNKILETAIESNSDYIISGDKHLLNIKKFKKIKIVSPAQFLNHYLKIKK